MAAKADARLYEPSPRAAHYDCCIGDNIYVCFGFTGDSSTAAMRELSRQVEVYDCYSKTWVQRKTTGTPPPGLVMVPVLLLKTNIILTVVVVVVTHHSLVLSASWIRLQWSGSFLLQILDQ